VSDIQVFTQTVYRAPTKGRRYLTARAAAIAEAGAMLECKYPSERPEWDIGDPGWHWRSDEAHLRTHKRLSRMILRRLRAAAASTPAQAESHLRQTLETALARIEDMLSDDDGQAFKEARKFLPVGRGVLAASPTQPRPQPLTDEEKRDLVKECGLDWHRGYMPLFDGDDTNRYAVLIEAVQAHCGITAQEPTE